MYNRLYQTRRTNALVYKGLRVNQEAKQQFSVCHELLTRLFLIIFEHMKYELSKYKMHEYKYTRKKDVCILGYNLNNKRINYI